MILLRRSSVNARPSGLQSGLSRIVSSESLGRLFGRCPSDPSKGDGGAGRSGRGVSPIGNISGTPWSVVRFDSPLSSGSVREPFSATPPSLTDSCGVDSGVLSTVVCCKADGDLRCGGCTTSLVARSGESDSRSSEVVTTSAPRSRAPDTATVTALNLMRCGYGPLGDHLLVRLRQHIARLAEPIEEKNGQFHGVTGA